MTSVKEADRKQSRTSDKPWLWKKGQSGNPKGRPSFAEEAAIIDAARQTGDIDKISNAFAVLYSIMANPKERTANRLKAAEIWLQYHAPKVPQAIQIQAMTEYTMILPGENPDEDENVIEMPALPDGDRIIDG